MRRQRWYIVAAVLVVIVGAIFIAYFATRPKVYARGLTAKQATSVGLCIGTVGCAIPFVTRQDASQILPLLRDQT